MRHYHCRRDFSPLPTNAKLAAQDTTRPTAMKPLLTLFLTFSLIGPVQAYDPLAKEENDYTPSSEEWREHELNIPETFDPDDLQFFTLKGRQDRFEYAIERSTLQAGQDGVVRFLLVIRSASGAVNSSYEGLRCGHRQYKVYAYGSATGLRPLAKPEWQEIPMTSNSYQATLYEDLLCNLSTGLPNPPDAIIQALRSDTQVATPFIPTGVD